jgi:Protein of unknown function (DUF2924)
MSLGTILLIILVSRMFVGPDLFQSGNGDKRGADRSRRLKPGTVLLREYQGERHTLTVVPNGYLWRETTYSSLSTIARAITGTTWSGPRLFGLRASGNRFKEMERESEKLAAGVKAGNRCRNHVHRGSYSR